MILLVIMVIIGITSLVSLIWNIHIFRHFDRSKRIEGKISLTIWIILSAFGIIFATFLIFVIIFGSNLV